MTSETWGPENAGGPDPGPPIRGGGPDRAGNGLPGSPRSEDGPQQEREIPGAEGVVVDLAWSRQMSEKLFRLLGVVSGTLLVSLAGNVLLIFEKTPPVYFASTSDGRILPMAPLSDPLRSSRWLLSWTGRVAVDAIATDYVTPARTFDRIRRRFSPPAFDSFYRATEGSGLPAWIARNRMVVSAVPEQAPEIVASGVVGGKRAWKIQIPMTVQYANGEGTTPKHYVVRMTVTRVPVTVNPEGVWVTQFVMGER